MYGNREMDKLQNLYTSLNIRLIRTTSMKLVENVLRIL
jgi:hypothetical protein